MKSARRLPKLLLSQMQGTADMKREQRYYIYLLIMLVVMAWASLACIVYDTVIGNIRVLNTGVQVVIYLYAASVFIKLGVATFRLYENARKKAILRLEIEWVNFMRVVELFTGFWRILYYIFTGASIQSCVLNVATTLCIYWLLSIRIVGLKHMEAEYMIHQTREKLKELEAVVNDPC